MEGINLFYKTDGVYIKINENITSLDIKKYLNRKQVKQYDIEKIDDIAVNNDGSTYKIAEAQNEISIDAGIEVKVCKEKLNAYVIMLPPDGGQELDFETFMNNLKENNILYGINEKIVKKLCSNPVYHKQMPIATGKEPIKGKDGWLEIVINISKELKPIVMEDGSTNYRDLNLIKNVRKGDLLAIIHPPEEGILGYNVYGEEIKPEPGKEAKVTVGRRVEIVGEKVLSLINGHFVYENNKIDVTDTFELVHDVDSSTGNLDFLGNIIVRGNVISGMKIKAEGTVEITGQVEAAQVEAGKSIILHSGIRGMNKGLLKSGGGIVSKHIEYCEVYCKDDLESDLLLHSKVFCNGSLILKGKKGLLVGGIIKVAKEVKAITIGTEMWVPTRIEIGISPEIREEFKSINKKLTENESQLISTKQIIQYIKRVKDAGKLTPDKRKKLEKALILYKNLIIQKEQIEERIVKLKEIIENGQNGKVTFTREIFPGTQVTIGSSMMVVKSHMKSGKLYISNGEVVEGSI